VPKQGQRTPTDEDRLNKYLTSTLYEVFKEIPNPYAPRMKITPLSIEGVKLITVDRYEDQRGCFSDHWHEEKFKEITGDVVFRQDSFVTSTRGVVRGLHYQLPPYEQYKLVRCVEGAVQDVIVDLRKSSKTFGTWINVKLVAEHHDMVWIPPGCAHGYAVLGGRANILYKMTQIHNPEHERTLLWNDPTLDIKWECGKRPILSTKDKEGIPFKDIDLFE